MSQQDTLDELLRAVGRIEGQLQSLADLPERVHVLESWKAKVLGMCAAVAAIVTAGVNIVATHWSIKT